jgi:hypothetical protein
MDWQGIAAGRGIQMAGGGAGAWRRRSLTVGALSFFSLAACLALPTAAGAVLTQTFSTVGTHPSEVPAGVTGISVDAFGARGGNGGNGGGGGAFGARARATTVTTTPGETLTVVVGGRGGDAADDSCVGGSGGSNGGGTGGGCSSPGASGGGGGGASAEEGVLTVNPRIRLFAENGFKGVRHEFKLRQD